MSNNNAIPLKQSLQGKRTQKIVLRIQKIYLALLIIGFFILSLVLFRSGLQVRRLEQVITIIILSIVYYGLRKRRGWVIPLILFFSVFNCLSLLIRILHPVEDIRSLVLKLISCLFFFFYAYQMYFFQKKEVRALFGHKGIIIF